MIQNEFSTDLCLLKYNLYHLSMTLWSWVFYSEVSLNYFLTLGVKRDESENVCLQD